MSHALKGREVHKPRPEATRDRSEGEALFRYRMIAPLIDPLATEQEKTRWRREVTGREHMLPDGSRRKVSGRSLLRWVQAYRIGGFDGLKRLPRQDQGVSRVLSSEVKEFLRSLKEEEPQRSIPQIIRLLETAGKVEPGSLSPKTVWRYLASLGLSQQHRPPSQEQYRRFEAARSGDLWQGDASHGLLLPDPEDPQRVRRTYLLAFLDDRAQRAPGFIPHAEFFWAEDLYALELCFQRAILRGGLPHRVYVDRAQRAPDDLSGRGLHPGLRRAGDPPPLGQDRPSRREGED
ncbi:helix-turn-helix domain-containing protein [Limnochorda pilosa]|nr:helix-turn-helix domain-containing protein [Limnochorda pilosa]